MKKHKKFRLLNNATIVLLIVSTCLFLFTGCQGKSNTTQKVSANSNTNSNQKNKGKLNADDMKKKMQENINSLVTDGTINQSQGDKILEALTENTQRFNGGGKSQNNQQNSPNNTQGNAQNTPQNNSNNTQGNKQNMQKNSALSKLVSDGVITQAQADAVMQKVRGNFNRPKGN